MSAKLNILDRAISVFSPVAGAKRLAARKALHIHKMSYDAAKRTKQRNNASDNSSANDLADYGVLENLRGQARSLDQNMDIAHGILDALVRNIIGPTGIGVEPQPKKLDGSVDTDLAKQISKAREEWERSPETTGQLTWTQARHLMCRTWLRDGEAFAKDIMGIVRGFEHGSQVPYSLELLEPDHLPPLTDKKSKITQGVQLDNWSRAKAYWFLDEHPSNAGVGYKPKVRRVPADRVHHLKMCDRLHQVRGVSLFAPVLNRLNDIDDYEQAERIAARMAAKLGVAIKRGGPDAFDTQSYDEDELGNFAFENGMVMELAPGESIETFESKRPSTLQQTFLDTQHRMVAAGTNTNFSTVSKNYNGSYSAQRQELIENWGNYAMLSQQFVDMLERKVYEKFISMAVLAGVIVPSADTDLSTLADADYILPQMPWIDPLKEANGFKALIELGVLAPQSIIRARGQSPSKVLDNRQAWADELKKRGLSDPMQPEPSQADQPDQPESDD